MSMQRETLSELLEPLYESLASSGLWGDFLRKLTRRFGCDMAAITFHEQGNLNPNVLFSVGMPQRTLHEYTTYYGARNPFTPWISKRVLRTGSWHGRTSILSGKKEWTKTEYFDWVAKHDLYYSVGGKATSDGATFTALSVIRERSAGPFDKKSAEVMRLLIPHFKRAFQIRRALRRLHSCLDGANAALDHMETGLIGVDVNSRMILLNRRAESILQNQEWIAIRQGKLTATNSVQAATLEALTAAAAVTGAGRGTQGPNAITLSGRRTLKPLLVTITPFRSSHFLTEERPCALIFLSDPSAKPAARASLTSALFGLSPAEARMADLLLEELEIGAAADRMHLTIGTARFMLKSIFQKTGTHRQSQLIRLLASIPGTSHS